jgi:hypothetical protein
VPRRHPRPERSRPPAPAGDSTEIEQHPDGEFYVRRLTGITVVKAYRCPGCEQMIEIGKPHTVAWSVDGDSTDRRHWHTACWAARDRRHPPGTKRKG